MKFTSFLHKKLIDLLGERRIVVWYDAERNFTSFATTPGALTRFFVTRARSVFSFASNPSSESKIPLYAFFSDFQTARS